MQITFGLDIQVDQPMAGNLIEHVVEESGIPGIEIGLATAIQRRWTTAIWVSRVLRVT